jgi:hypothetical protein
MDDLELRKLIESLHDEIQNTHTVDEKSQELLVHLDADIRKLLAQTGAATARVHPTMLRRMEEGLDQFEITHPALTMLLSKLLEALNNAGI